MPAPNLVIEPLLLITPARVPVPDEFVTLKVVKPLIPIVPLLLPLIPPVVAEMPAFKVKLRVPVVLLIELLITMLFSAFKVSKVVAVPKLLLIAAFTVIVPPLVLVPNVEEVLIVTLLV